MQPLNRLKGSGSDTGFTAWHPNFRNTTELPDTKTVRTKFFVNAAAVVLALGALLYFTYTEYALRGLNHEIDGWQQRIDTDAKAIREAIAQYKKFKEQEASSSELVAFRKSEKLIVSDFLIVISNTLPESLLITAIQCGEKGATLRGVVKGPPELASGTASSYEKLLRDNKELSAQFGSISLATLTRDAGTGFLNFEIALQFEK
jgi:hypothetical protein